MFGDKRVCLSSKVTKLYSYFFSFFYFFLELYSLFIIKCNFHFSIEDCGLRRRLERAYDFLFKTSLGACRYPLPTFPPTLCPRPRVSVIYEGIQEKGFLVMCGVFNNCRTLGDIYEASLSQSDHHFILFIQWTFNELLLYARYYAQEIQGPISHRACLHRV